jgi:hypothetical protein
MHQLSIRISRLSPRWIDPTGRRHEILAEARSVEEEPAAAVGVGVDARLDALVAARAAVQVDQHQLLTLDQPQSLERRGELDLVAVLPGRR